MTIKDVIDYVDRVKKNEFTTEEKTRWINEIEGYVQIQIMLLAQPECISYCYSSESEQSGISFPADNQMRLPRKLKAHVGGFLKIEGLVTYPENNLSGLAILSISDNGKLIEFEQGTFPQTGETPESAIAQIAFDGQDTELLVPAPFERLYYEYVLAKISENLEENSAQNNRLATFDETWQNYAEWYANTYKPGDGKAVFKGYYIAGKQGVPGPAGPPGKNVYNVRLTTSAESITADKTYAELTEQLEAGVMVIPVVDGKAFTSNAVKNDNTIVFTAADDSVSPVLKGYSVNSSNVWTKFTKLLPTEAQLNSKYTKPASGIPKTDLASYVQASLDKADTALQEHQSLAAYRTSADQDVIDGSKQDKLIAGENITIAADGKTISAAGKANVIGCFEVTLTKQDDGSYTSSKTYAQVKEEIANNNCFMLIDGYNGVFILTRIGGVTVEFAGMLDGTDGWMRVEVSSDERWEVVPEPRITLDWYNALADDIGKLTNLTTTDKSNLVAAINEVKGIADNKQNKLIAGENITIAADGKTISATGGGSGSVQSDWNQNDSTAADYVKNRPFYTGNPVETVLVEENTISFGAADGMYMGTLSQEVPVIVGETYKVYWDGTAYECVCADAEGTSALGNLSIMGVGPDTGEPFLVGVMIGQGTIIYTTDTSASHTISISRLVKEIVKIDKKYLPFLPKPTNKSYLTFNSPNNFTLTTKENTKTWNGTLEYFASDGTWTVWDGTSSLSAEPNGGGYVIYLRGTGNTVISGGSGWDVNASDIACIGNIENLLDYATVESGEHPVMAEQCFGCTFSGWDLTQAPELPATTLAPHCYDHMFESCTSLTQAPELPATTLADSCYQGMFWRCASLTQAPKLPATTLANYCYNDMFLNCTSLTQIPALSATTIADGCYERMFKGCTSLKLSTTKTEEYTQEYRIPFSGDGTTATDALADMFYSTGGTFTGTPSINTTYYLSSENMIVRGTEIATLNGYVKNMIDNAGYLTLATLPKYEGVVE